MHPPEDVDTFQATILPSNISKIPVSHRKTQNMIQTAAVLLSKPGPASRHHHAGHTAVSRIGLDIPENQCAKEIRSDGCKYEEFENQEIGYADIQLSSRNANEAK